MKTFCKIYGPDPPVTGTNSDTDPHIIRSLTDPDLQHFLCLREANLRSSYVLRRVVLQGRPSGHVVERQ